VARYTFRRRVRWAVGAALLCAAALPCLIGGLAYQTSAASMWGALNEMAPAMFACMDRVRDELEALDAGDKTASFSRLNTWVTECDEEVQRVNKKLRDRPESALARKRMNEEWAAVVQHSRTLAAAGRSSDPGNTAVMLHQLQVDFEFFENSYRDSVAAALSTTNYKYRMGGYLLYAGCVAVAAACLACCVFVASTLLVGDSECFDPARLRDELKRIAATERFMARINLLRRDAPGPAPGGWDLSLDKVMYERRTHVCFTATARAGDEEALLWGRCYKWAGWVKSIERIVLPTYHKVYWTALWTLHANNIPGPLPVACATIHDGPFRRGSFVLMEHLGALEKLPRFVSGRFSLLEPAAQREVLQRFADLVAVLHAAGIYRIKPRHVHLRKTDDPQARSELFMLDLDKIILWPNCPAFVARVLRRRDERNILRQLKRRLTQPLFAELRQLLAAAGPAEKDS